MAKKTVENIKSAANSVVDAARPMVEKVAETAKPAAQKAVKAGSDAAQKAAATARKVTPKKPQYFVQFNGREIDMETISDEAKALFRAENKRTAIISCRVYLKPEDNAAYYVINDTFFGRINL